MHRANLKAPIFCKDVKGNKGYAKIDGFQQGTIEIMNFEALVLIEIEDYSLEEAIAEVFEKYSEMAETIDEKECV